MTDFLAAAQTDPAAPVDFDWAAFWAMWGVPIRILAIVVVAVLLRVAEISGLPLYVTESGASFHDYVTPDGQVHDPERIAYLDGYTGAVGRAVAAGADVRGYFAWSFLDNFEWAAGYYPRFGFFSYDRRSLVRRERPSARAFRRIARSGRLPG